ncbi:MAG: 2-isopropylmalate synthase [archaeon]
MKQSPDNYNFIADVRGRMDLPDAVFVFDTTLRDGEQTPGVSLSGAEKMHIAEQLDKLGVAVIEAGFPINSNPEKEIVKQIAAAGFKSKICALSRVVENDIDACIDCDIDIIHTFISTSDIHIKYQMDTTREEVKERAIKAVSYIKNQGFECLFSPMDATRTDLTYLIEVCEAVSQAGADRINIPDTVGVMNPQAMKYLVSKLKSSLKVPIEVHCHNDFGLAVANSLAGVEAGASYVQVTVNGLGERAGNASLEQTVMGLESLYNIKTGIKTEMLTETSKLVERFTFINMPPNTPLVGKNAFTHESGIHAAAVLKSNMTFEPIVAESVGQRSRLVMGKHTGKHAVEDTLKGLGYSANEKQVEQITVRIKDLAEKKKKIFEEDLAAIADEVIGNFSNVKDRVILEEFNVFTSNKLKSVSSVILSVDGIKKIGVSSGVGSVDAATKAILSAVPLDMSLKEYNLKAVSGGTDSLANVLIRIADKQKNEYQAEAVHEDIVLASINALIKGMNKIMANNSKQG